jgi:hypothetical protein
MHGNEQLAAMQAELVHRTEKRKKNKNNANENKRSIAIKGMHQYFLVIEKLMCSSRVSTTTGDDCGAGLQDQVQRKFLQR